MNRSTFGRREGAQPVRRQAAAQPVSLEPVALPIDLPADVDLGPDADGPSPDDELQAWKAQRSFRIPWHQLSLMASICFGLASFVLPDSVNDGVDWVLYGLSAMSLYVWFSGRSAKAKA